MRRRRVLVTGSSGGLGRALVARLSRAHEVAQLDLVAPSDHDGPCGARVVVGSVTDPAAVAEAMEGADAVVHAAAIPASRPPIHEVIHANVVGTVVVLEAAGVSGSVEQFIYLSSVMWHGFHDELRLGHAPSRLPIREDLETLAADWYARSKVQAEEWCRVYVERYRKPVVSLRPSRIITPQMEPSFEAVPARLDRPHLYDYVGTGDLVDGIERALEYHPRDGFDVFLMNADDQYSQSPSLELAGRYWPEASVDRDRLASCGGYGAFVDCSRARDRLGWSPRFRCRRTAIATTPPPRA